MSAPMGPELTITLSKVEDRTTRHADCSLSTTGRKMKLHGLTILADRPAFDECSIFNRSFLKVNPGTRKFTFWMNFDLGISRVDCTITFQIIQISARSSTLDFSTRMLAPP